MVIFKSATLGLCTVRTVHVFLALSLLSNVLIFLWTYSNPSTQQRPAPFSFSFAPPGGTPHSDSHHHTTSPSSSPHSVASRQILFVGGCPRSGTTLARAMLDAHPDVHCGEETRVIPRVLGLRTMWRTSFIEHKRLLEADISDKLLDEATAAFVSEIIVHHGEPAEFLCNKDPLVLSYMGDVVRMFPNAKFVLMIRDARAVAYSIVSRNVTISGVDHRSYLSAAEFWNKVMTTTTRDCTRFGKKRCLMVYYEKLVQSPREWMEKILDFGGIPWHENVLHHDELINKEVFLSK